MISQLTLCITIGKKVHCIRKCGDKKSRLKQKLWNVRTSVNWHDSRRAGRFLVIMDNLLLSEVQIIEKNRKQTKTTVGLYWEVYFRKTKGIIKILVKKKIIIKKERKEKKRTILNLAYWERLNKITQTTLRQNFNWPLSPSKEKKH